MESSNTKTNKKVIIFFVLLIFIFLTGSLCFIPSHKNQNAETEKETENTNVTGEEVIPEEHIAIPEEGKEVDDNEPDSIEEKEVDDNEPDSIEEDNTDQEEINLPATPE